ncbi:MAG: flagellar motor switch protein FliM [Syntrophomonadaceae bacterium]|nr:flagellar motor switch protein FliM [Syntrophomonadaceae bacterium]MDH7498117.1 flagellar motor switch protein FliM [Syntrophomonadaceae bacterium]
MNEILSQEEIDALLTALSKGDVDADELKQEQSKRKVRVYDFRRPNKFSKDQIHTLHVIFENYARTLGTYLSAQLRAAVQTELLSVEQITYSEFTRSLPNPSVLCVFTLPPLEGTALFEINPNLGFAMLDRLLGGPGLPTERIRPLTEIESTLMERFGQRMLSLLEEPWSTIVNITPVLDHLESNPQFTQIVSPGEMVVIISLETQIGEVFGIMNMCIPFLVLEPILNKLNVHYYYSSTVKEPAPETVQALRSRLENAMIPVRVMVGKATITVKDLLDLSVGDVIPLERHVKDDFEVVVGTGTKFLGTPGVVGNRVAVKVTKVVEEEDDNA